MKASLKIEQLEMSVEYSTTLPAVRFNGPAYEAPNDKRRLGRQLRSIIRAMESEGWWTLSELEEKTGAPGASISAQLRHLRKKRFGSNTVERRRRGDPKNGLYEYRLKLNPATAVALRARLVSEEVE